MLTPQDIAKKQFSVARLGKGYAQDEVDDFLDALEVDYSAAIKAAEDAQRRLGVALGAQKEAATTQLPPLPLAPPKPSPAAEDGPSMASIAMLLETAQQTADQIIAKASSDAAGITGQAQIDATKIKDAATADAAAQVAAMQAELAEMTQKIESLKAVHADTAARLQGALNQLGSVA